MRLHAPVRPQRAVLALGALCTATTLAPAASAAAQTTPQGAPTAKVSESSLRYGGSVSVTGNAPGPGGSAVTLQYRPRGGSWSSVAESRTGEGGRYRLAVKLSRSGAVRVVPGTRAQSRSFSASGGGSAPASAERDIAVAARIATSSRRLNVNAGRTAFVRGSVRRPAEGREVRLQRRAGNGWTTVDRARTDGEGRFRLSYKPRKAGSATVRVRFNGDALNAAGSREVGRLNVFRRSFASWYGPGFYGRRTACGQTFSASIMGVAHKTLPCGTKLTLKKGSRTVRVRVIDRGPFTPGREFDLSPRVKRALGFGSTGVVYSTR